MKQISLAARFAKKSIFSYVLLLILTLIAVYRVILNMGLLEYVYYGEDDVRKYLYNADYVMGDFDVSLVNRGNRIKSYDGVKSVIYRLDGYIYLSRDKNGRGEVNRYELYMYSEGYGRDYKEKLTSGSWREVMEKAGDGEYRCVTNIEGIDPGDEFYILPYAYDPDGTGVAEAVGKVKATGRLYPNGKILSASKSSNKMDLTDCYEYRQNIIIMPYSKELIEATGVSGGGINYYVIYEDDISDMQKDYIRENEMKKNGYVAMTKVLEETDERKKKDDYIFHGELLIPMMTIYLSAMTFIAVSVISVYRYMKEFSVYYMVGSTKWKIVRIINMSMFPVLVIDVMFGFLLINNYGRFEKFRVDALPTDYYGYVMYNSFMVYIIIFLLVLLFISNIIVMLIISRMSPTRMYRQLNG